MSQVVASQPYCLENSIHLTRPGSEGFYRIDGNNAPTVIDKNQTRRLYRLQRTPYVDTRLHLDNSNIGYEKQGYFESILQQQMHEGSMQPTRAVYHRPTDMSDESMARFSFGKAWPDPQRIVPSEMTTVRNHPAAITILRHEQSSGTEIVPRFTDRSVSDRTLRGRIGPGGTVNRDEDCKQVKTYLRNQVRLPSQPKLTTSPRIQQRPSTDEMARHYMYTSAQQAASDEVAWDSKLPSKIPVPLTTYETYGSDPLFRSTSLTSLQDSRTSAVLEWDRVQSRNGHYIRKPFDNVAPLPRAHQISGYSGSIGGDHIQDIDDPKVDFKPYTIVRSEQPKTSIRSFKTNIPSYTGRTHWTKVDPVSHYDQFGHAYTTTEAFHKPLPFDTSSERHTALHGQLSCAVTTVIPRNPFNQMANNTTTINSSLDSRPHVLLPQLPAKKFPSPREKEQIVPE